MHGYRVKLVRAQELLDSLSLEVNAFRELARRASTKTSALEPGDLEYVVTVRSTAVLPERISVLAGEIIHHLRSSLDHLVTSLVVANGGAIERWHQFPICDTKKKYNDAVRMRCLDGMKATSVGLIDAVQPYRQPTPANTVLSVVQAFDNQDKHRLLLVTSAVAALHNEMVIGTKPELAPPDRQGIGPAIVQFSDMGGAKRLTEDATRVLSIKLLEPAPDIYVETEVIFDVCFQRCGLVDFAQLIPTLQGLVTGVTNTVEDIAKEF